MATDRGTSIRASQLKNFSVTGYDIQNASISGSEKLIDSSVTDENYMGLIYMPMAQGMPPAILYLGRISPLQAQ